MDVLIKPNCIFVAVPYYQRDKAKWLGGEWHHSRKMWKFPNTLQTMRQLMVAFPELKINTQFVEYGKRYKERMERLLQIKAQEDTSGDDRLRPYQRVDVAYLKELCAAGIFNEQRTGKTPTTLVLCKELGIEKAMFVVPATLRNNWAKEIRTWVGVEPTIIVGDKRKREQIFRSYDTGYLVISYETLRTDIDWWENICFDVVVADEAHRLRNHKTSQSQALHKLKAGRKYALTGTPTIRSGTDIFGILSWLRPDTYTTYWGFVKRYFHVHKGIFGMEIGDYREEHKQELQELIGMLSVQRKRQEVMAWLPPKQYQTIEVEMEEEQRKHYDEMLHMFFTRTEDGQLLDAPTVLAQLTRLRQLCLDPHLVGLPASSAKTQTILEWLQDNPQPVVIMSSFTSYLEILHFHLQKTVRKVGMITGKQTDGEKTAAELAFQNGELDVLLCNTISAGTGLTLDRADTIIFTDRPWNPADQAQAEDRIVPTSEERNHSINIIFMTVKDSVDQRIDAILDKKKSLTEVINKGAREAILQLLGKEEVV